MLANPRRTPGGILRLMTGFVETLGGCMPMPMKWPPQRLPRLASGHAKPSRPLLAQRGGGGG